MDNREISLKEIFNVLWKEKLRIVIIAIVGLLMLALGSFSFNRLSAQISTIVTFQWDGIDSGQYPNGTEFDYSVAFDSEILDKAIEEMDLSVEVSNLKSAFLVEPIVPKSTLLLIEQALENGEDLKYNPTSYKLSINSGEIGVTLEEGSELLNKIVDEFENEFKERFISESITFDYSSSEINGLEYIDAHKVLLAQVDKIQDAMRRKMSKNANFVSEELDIGFSEILDSANLLQDINLTEMEYRTKTFLLARDEEYLLVKFIGEIDDKTRELNKLEFEEADLLHLVDIYDGSKTTIIIPGVDGAADIEFDSYYNTLLEDLTNIHSKTAELAGEIDYLQAQVDKLDGTDLTFTVTDEDKEEQENIVEVLLTKTLSRLDSLAEDANIIMKEYNELTSSQQIDEITPPEYESKVNVLVFSAIGLVAGAGVGVLTVLFKNDWNN